MKIIVILVVAIFVGSVLIGNSYADTAPRHIASIPEIYLQLVVRDAQGHMVAYIEPTRMYFIDPTSIHEFLDLQKNKTIITKNGKTFEEIKFPGGSGTDQEFNAFDSFNLYYNGDMIIETLHNEYFVLPGDTYASYWTVVRTVG